MFALRSPLKTGALAACAAALMAVASPALAQDPTFAQFQKVCVASDGDPAAAARVVGADSSWQSIDPAMLGGDVPFDNLQAWLKMGDAGFEMVLTGDVTDEAPGMQSIEGLDMVMSVCAVGGMPADYAAADGAAQRWTGAQAHPELSQDGMRGYLFEVSSGQPKPLPADMTDEQLGMQALGGDLRMLMTADQGGMVMVMYMQPKVQ